jgi:hypothetical protein
MARKFGHTYRLSKNFEDYSYIINGIGGIGKTTMVYEIGKLITGSNEGTFIITCGVENKPKHIDDAFGDVAPDFKTFTDIVKELCENKAEYPDTKFVAIDSMDEFARITENYVVAEWNKTCDINDRAKSIAQAYKGFQKGESRACDLMLTQIMKLQNAGYSLLLVGHTKTKLKEDVITKIQFEQLTCNLDNKYYNALKDKVNLVAMCYTENVVDNVEEKKNAFTKKMDKIGQLTDRKRVMVFADTENAVDCKSHFPYIVAKVDFGAANFIQAVRDALDEQSKHPNGTSESKPVAKAAPISAPVPAPAPVEEDPEIEAMSEQIDEEDDMDLPFDLDDEDEDDSFDEEAVKEEINALFKNADAALKKEVRGILNGGKLANIHDEATLKRILEALS